MSNDDVNLSSDDTISDPQYHWTTSEGEDSVDGVDSRMVDVDRQVTIEDPSNVVAINTKGILEQGGVRAVATIVDHPEYVDVDEATTSGRPLGVLDESPASLVSEENLCSVEGDLWHPKRCRATCTQGT
jgi:hypothetical protein